MDLSTPVMPAPTFSVPVEGIPAALHRGERELPFVEFEPGVEMQVLQVDIPSGLWVVRMRMQPGATLPTHRHGGEVFAFTLKGAWKYLEYPEVNTAGSYLYEPAGSIHTLHVPASNTEVTDVWFAIRGPNLNLDENGNVSLILDAGLVLKVYLSRCRKLGFSPARGDRRLNSMDLRFTDEEIAFRAEVRAFIDAALPAALRRKMVEGRALTKHEIVSWQRVLNEKGWATPGWPKDHGGPGWSVVQRWIFLDELHQAPAPEPLSFNVNMIGPVLCTFGTDAQKQRFLPRIANLDDWWCQGFSEPGAGSDLASLKTTAKRDGDHYIVNGQKTWQGMAQHADWMFTLVRTDPSVKPQAGITMLLIDMKTPGVTVRPIITIDGRHEVNEVFLDNVRVPLDCRVGDEHKGWDVTKFLLGNERTGIARIGMSKHLIRRAKSLAARTDDGDASLTDRARFREQAAALEIELKALEITQMRMLDAMKEHSDKPDARSSILKIKGTELRQAASELLLRAAGPMAASCADEFDDSADVATTFAPIYFTLRAASIYGGSNEVQKNILAKAVLGL